MIHRNPPFLPGLKSPNIFFCSSARLTKEDNFNSELSYIKVLGFNNEGKKYLNKIKKESKIPITINRESLIYDYEMKASYIYDLLTNQNTSNFEIKNKPLYK